MKYLFGLLCIASCAQAQAPQPPTITAVQAISGDKAYVYWSPATDLSGTGLKKYTIEAQSDNGSVIRDADPTKTQAAVVDLRAGTAYSFTIRATDNLWHTSVPSAPVIATTPAYVSPALQVLGSLTWGSSSNYRRAAQFGTRTAVVYSDSQLVFHGGQLGYTSLKVAVVDGAGAPVILALTGYPTSVTCSLGGPPIDCGAQIGSVGLVSSTDLVVFYISDLVVTAALFNIDAAASSATFVSSRSYTFGTSGAAWAYVGDGTALASGGWAGVSQGFDPNSQTYRSIWFYLSPGRVWSTLPVANTTGAWGTQISVAQNPGDGGVWAFEICDGAYMSAISAQHLTEIGGALSLINGNVQTGISGYFIDFQSPIAPNQEDPFLVARPNPAHKSIVLAFQGNTGGPNNPDTIAYEDVLFNTPFSSFWQGNAPYGPCFCTYGTHLGFVEVSASGALTYDTLFPDFVERVAPWGDFIVNGDGSLSVVYANLNTNDMSRDILQRRDYTSAGWGAAMVVTEHVNQDLGQVNMLPGAVYYNAPDNSIRMLQMGIPVVQPPPPPPPCTKKNPKACNH